LPGTQHVVTPSLHDLPYHLCVPREPMLASDRLRTGH
jgi:hypothetical protein